MRTVNVILAAGVGTRMKSSLPKVLHPLLGKPIVQWSVEMAESVGALKPTLVVGHGHEQVRTVIGDRVDYVEQMERLGTGHALMQARPALEEKADAVVVTYGDMPLLRTETIKGLTACFEEACLRDDSTAMAMLTVVREDPQGFGRIVRNSEGEIVRIVEEADCTPDELSIRELNPGIYCFNAQWLWRNLDAIPLSAKGEYYLTDMVGLAVSQGRRIVSMAAPPDEVDGINTRVHLAAAIEVMRHRVLQSHMLNGVTVVDPASTYVESNVAIGQDTVLLPGTLLQGDCVIGSESIVGPYSQIVDSRIGDRCRVAYSVVKEALMEDDSDVGPFGHLRKGAHLGKGAHMGNFGEMKNSYLGPGAKMGHFSYLGDAYVGPEANIGAGTVTCNYDGERKSRTTIGERAFIGSDTMLIAPVRIGERARTGAGSVVTRDVEDDDTVYGVPARKRADDNRTTDGE